MRDAANELIRIVNKEKRKFNPKYISGLKYFMATVTKDMKVEQLLFHCV